MVGNVGKRKWQLVNVDPAHPPNSSSSSSDIGLIATTGALHSDRLRVANCSEDTCVSTDEVGRSKCRLVPRILVTSADTPVHGDVMPKVDLKVLGTHCISDTVRHLTADPSVVGSYQNPRTTPLLLTNGVGHALSAPLLIASDLVPEVAPCGSAEACVAFSHACFYFSAEIFGSDFTALLDCGASENLLAENLALSLRCRRHTLRQQLTKRLANGEKRCSVRNLFAYGFPCPRGGRN